MQSTITLTITQGQLSGKQYIFDTRTTCIIGRNDDCNLSIPDEVDKRVSRYHCLLDINPPEIRIRDLGSLNGTYINNQKIGQRPPDQTAEAALKLNFPEYDLQDGDEITLGNTILQITIKIPQPINQNLHIKTPQVIQPKPQARLQIFDIIKNLINLATGGNKNLNALQGYQIIKSIGKGGFGEVYLAQHSQTGKYVALKVMLPAVAGEDKYVQMFLREIENMKTLQHPNVVELFDYGYAENLFFLTMEYYEGGNVYDLMQQLGGKLPVDLAVGIILQVLDGLTYTHNAEIPYVKLADGKFGQGKGLVHRDLKPSNIFLSNINGKLVAKIGDYGLSKSFDLAGLSGQTFTKTIAGTPGFIPRQQVLKFKEAKPDVDVWAAAACLYNMLTGYIPRDFPENEDPWLAVLQNHPVPIHQRDASIPAKLAAAIDLALVEKPNIHFQSAVEFKNALLAN